MLRTATEYDKQNLKEIWKDGFHDPDIFVDFYFEKRFIPNNTFLFEEDGEILASLQVDNYEMKFNELMFKSSYILGVATNSNHRKKGYSKKVLSYCLKKLFEQGITIATLIPAEPYLFEVYRKSGFTEAFKINTETFEINEKFLSINQTDINISVEILTKFETISNQEELKLFEFYSNVYKKNSCTILKTKEDFEFTIEEFLGFEGEVIICKDEFSQIKALAFTCKSSEDLTIYKIKEFIFSEAKYKKTFLNEICKIKSQKTIELNLPPFLSDNENLKNLACARILNVHYFLQKIANEGIEFSVKVVDEIIKENNNCYILKNNEVIVINDDKNCDYNFNINELTSFVFSSNFDLKKHWNKSNYFNLHLN